jgi:DUSAM domain-containing protein
MDDRSKHEKDDWSQLRELGEMVGEKGELDPAQWSEFLLRIGPAVGLAVDECQEAMATSQGAAGLVREAQRCLDEGNERFNQAMLQSKALAERGRRYEAGRVMKDLLGRETVLFFREMAEYQLERLARMRLIAEREYRFVSADPGQAGKVTLRVGAPEQDTPSDWLLKFEVLGPAEERAEHVVHAADALQALHRGLQRIAAELQSLQDRSGGTLTFHEEEGPGLPPET